MPQIEKNFVPKDEEINHVIVQRLLDVEYRLRGVLSDGKGDEMIYSTPLVQRSPAASSAAQRVSNYPDSSAPAREVVGPSGAYDVLACVVEACFLACSLKIVMRATGAHDSRRRPKR